MVRFLCELFRRTEYKPEKAIAAAITIDPEGRKISKISTEAYPTSSYWLDWGGVYDHPTNNFIQLYFDGFLSITDSIAQLILSGSAMYKDTDLVYFATDLYPWQYPESATELLTGEGYSSSVADPSKPSDDVINGLRYPVKMSIPSMSLKIPDAVSGTALQLTSFTVTLENQDGTFDLTESNNFFNTPIYVLKSFIENPSYSDYQIIRRGFIDNMPTSFTQFTINAATYFRSLSEDAHKVINTTDYPSAGTYDNTGKNIPLAWGTVSGVEPIQVSSSHYILIDPDYMDSIDAVYDGDGNVISSANYTLSNGLLYMTGGTQDPDHATITSNANNKIGQIITEEMQEKSKILYASGVWDTDETDDYISSCASLNLFFEGGSVRDLVVEVLKSDNAFLIEKSDGKLSLRKWGSTYTTHSIESWLITKQPDKNFVDSKYYTTKPRVIYSGGIWEDNSQEPTISEIYRKKQTIEYETALSTLTEAKNLATELLARYGQRPEVWKVPIGINTNTISLLDKVTIDLIVNGRVLSNKNNFIVKEIDVAQDVLTLEAVGTITTSDGILATPSGIGYEGDMSGGFETGSEQIMAELYNREDT